MCHCANYLILQVLFNFSTVGSFSPFASNSKRSCDIVTWAEQGTVNTEQLTILVWGRDTGPRFLRNICRFCYTYV